MNCILEFWVKDTVPKKGTKTEINNNCKVL